MSDTAADGAKGLDKDLLVQALGWSISLEPLEACASGIRTDAVRPPAAAFRASLERLQAMADLPAAIASTGVDAAVIGLVYVVAQVDATLRGVSPSSEQFKKLEGPFSAYRRILDEINTDDTGAMATLRTAPLHAVLADERYVRGAAAFRASAVILLWSAAEHLFRDLWVAAVDAAGTAAGHRVLRSLRTDDEGVGISQHSIQVDVLARHGFKLGTVLQRKFNWSSVDGAQRAYVTAFSHPESLEKVLKSKFLHFLENARHVYVHRGGIIDDEFARRVEGPPAGTPLNVTAPELRYLSQHVLEVGVQLIQAVDTRLANGAV
jgi:hypothetical protein